MALPAVIMSTSAAAGERRASRQASRFAGSLGSAVRLQSCSFGQWLECAAIVAACAGVCAAGPTPACLACAGGAYSKCKDCF